MYRATKQRPQTPAQRAAAKKYITDYRLTHRAEIQAKNAAYHANHRETIRIKSRAYYRSQRGPDLICHYEPCGKTFWRPFKASRPGKFCSIACMGLSYHAIYARQDRSGPWRGSGALKTFRKLVLARDGLICRMCGAKEKLEVNHILPWKDYPGLRFDPANGEVLCRDCHRYGVHGHVRGGK